MEPNDMTAPAEVEQQPVTEVPQGEQAQAPEQTEQKQEQAARRRALRVLASEVELPDTVDDDTFKRLEEITGQINKGVDGKFKEAAQLRQQAEAERQSITQWRQEQEEIVSHSTEVAALWHQLQPYQNVDWYAEISRQPDEASKQQVRDLRDWVTAQSQKMHGLAANVRAKRAAEQQQQEQFIAQITQAGTAILQQRIKDWSPAKQKAIVSMLPEYGIGKTDRNLDAMAMRALSMHPGLVQLAHDALLYRQSRQKATVESAAPEAPTPKPVSKVGGNAAAAKDPDKMTTSEWVAWRNQQLRKK